MNTSGHRRFEESPQGSYGSEFRAEGPLRLEDDRKFSPALRNTLLAFGALGTAAVATMTPQGKKILGELLAVVKNDIAMNIDGIPETMNIPFEEVLAAQENRLEGSFTGQSHVETTVIEVDFNDINAKAEARAQLANEAIQPLGEYEVQSGENLYDIIGRDDTFGVKIGETQVADVLALLELDSDILQPGQILNLPSKSLFYEALYGVPQG